MAVSRVEKCLEIYKFKKTKIVLTGVFGPHFNTKQQPHYEYLKRILIHKGLNENEILSLIPSRHSVEDATLSHFIIEKYQPNHLIVVTSDYHEKRAELIFKTVFAPFFNISVVSASSEHIDPTIISKLVVHENKAFRDLIENGVRFTIPNPDF